MKHRPTGFDTLTRFYAICLAGVAVLLPFTVAEHMAGRFSDVDADLGLGSGEFMVLTNDLTHEYVDENTGGS